MKQQLASLFAVGNNVNVGYAIFQNRLVKANCVVCYCIHPPQTHQENIKAEKQARKGSQLESLATCSLRQLHVLGCISDK